MNGLVNLTFPFFDTINELLATFLPIALQLVFWGVVSGVLAMLVYWLCSNQQKIKAQQKRITEIRAQMAQKKDESFDEVMRISMTNLRASLRMLGMVIGPALVSSLPILVILLWVSVHFGFAEPAAGARIVWATIPEQTPVKLEPADLVAQQASPQAGNGGGEEAGERVLLWPEPQQVARFVENGSVIHEGLPRDPVVPVIHQKRWWNSLLGNEGGYLAEQAETDVVRFELERLRLYSGVPDWLSGWELTYFLALIATSLAVKFGFKIA